jgi:serine-threonine kinase receptor-associated protein
MLTGGQEKKVRLFDLNRPDAEPSFIGGSNGETAHDGVIKSVLWVGDWGGVSGGNDGLIKSVIHFEWI